MSRFISTLRNKKLPWMQIAVIAIASGCVALSIYLIYLQTYFFSWRSLVYLLLIWLFSFVGGYYIWHRFINRQFFNLKVVFRLLIISACLVCGFLTIPSGYRVFYTLLPSHSMEVHIQQEHPDEEIVLEGFFNGIAYSSLDTIIHNEQWHREGNVLVAEGQDASLSWNGRTGESTYLIFRAVNGSRTYDLYWDGKREVIRTPEGQNEPVTLFKTFSIPWYVKAISIFIFGLAHSSLFLTAVLVLARIPTFCTANSKIRKYPWYLLAIPSIFVWGIYLLTFFPALMTLDSFYSWDQLYTGVYQDIHPVSYTLYLWILSRLWMSPAVVNVFQIVALSLTIAYGLGICIYRGLKPLFAWIIALIFAILPVNGLLINSIWKDIPYSISLFAVFIISINLVLTRGEWFRPWSNPILLGLLCAVASLMRHNGLVVTIVLFLILLILYRKYWKFILCSIFVFVAIWGFIKGPVYHLLNVKTFAVSGDQVMIYHIGAHIQAGTTMEKNEIAFLDAIQPYPKWWQYNSCSINNILANGQFDFDYYDAHRREGWQLFFALLQRDPMVDIRHIFESGAYLVKLEKSGCSPKIAFLRETAEGYIWMSPDNSLHENSQLPALIPQLYKIYEWESDVDLLNMPSFYFYVTLVIILAFTVRTSNPHWLMIATVPLIQTAVMFVANVSNEFRFQFPLVLNSILCLVFLFWKPQQNIKPDEEQVIEYK